MIERDDVTEDTAATEATDVANSGSSLCYPPLSLSLPLGQIVCGDNVATMATFPDACVDLVVTSPPYDNLRTYGGHSWDFEGVAQQLWRVIKPGGVVVWVVNDATVNGSETGTSFRQALRFMEIGFRLHDTMIWEKPNYAPLYPSLKRYDNVFEFMFILSKGDIRAWNPLDDKPKSQAAKDRGQYRTSYALADGSRYESEPTANGKDTCKRVNIWRVANGQLRGLDHPAPFPESLARDHILSWSNEGDTVLDPFSGSGTTCKMARLMGRRYIGIEINPEYCEIARKRLLQKVLEFGEAM